MPTDEPEGYQYARKRLNRITPRVPDDAQYLESWSNDAWLCDEVVVRVCFRGDRSRMRREATLGAALPPEIRYPRVLDFGESDELAWMVLERVPGTQLFSRWNEFEPSALRAVQHDFADMLRALHAWTPPGEVLAQLEAHDYAPEPDRASQIGHDLLPLPYPRWESMAAAARSMPFVDAGLIDAVTQRLNDLATHDPFAPTGVRRVVVHGDLQCLEHEGRITAMLDFEWARLGPPDAELVSFIRAAGYYLSGRHVVRHPVVQWLRDDYPGLFAAPDLRERLWITEIVYLLRQLVAWPMDGPPATQVGEHPIHTLPRAVVAPWEWA